MKQIPPPDKHIEWINTLRVMTMLLVIVGHSTYNVINTNYGGVSYPAPTDICTVQKLLTNIVSFIYSFHMPLFMAVSGACLFLGYHKTKDKPAFLHNKARRLLFPFILVTCLLSIPIKFLSGYYANSENIISDAFFGQVLLFGNSHLWFIVSLFLCFATFIAIEPLMSKYPRCMWILLTLMTTSSFMIFEKIHDGLGIFGFTKHMLYFAIGFYSIKWLCNFTLPKGIIVLSLILNLLFFIFLPKLNGNITTIMGHDIARYTFQLFSIPLAIWGCLNMTLISKFFSSNCNNILQKPLYGFLKKESYALYLYSDPINYIFIALFFSIEGFDLYSLPGHSLLAFIIRCIGSMLFATFVIFFLDFIKNFWKKLQPKTA